MPITRSEKSKSRIVGEPSEADINMMSARRSALTKRTPPHSVIDEEGVGSAPAETQEAPADIQTPQAATMRPVVTEVFHSPHLSLGKGNTAEMTYKQQEEELMAHISEVEKRRRSRVEEEVRLATSMVEPKPAPPLNRVVSEGFAGKGFDSRFDAVLRKRAEIEARMILARREVEAAEARSKMALAELELLELESEESDGHHNHVEQWLNENRRMIHEATTEAPIREKRSEILELAEAIAKLSGRASNIPESRCIELPYFNGSSEEWLAFKRSYDDTAKSFSPAQNLARLRRALQGSARETVKSLLFTAEDPYEVLRGLEARFGRPGAMALAELEKLKNLPRITENPNDICVFASEVKNTVATIKALGKVSYLSSPEAMKAILERLPSAMRFRWYAYYKSHQYKDIPELLLISNFLEAEADMCADFAPLEVTVPRSRPHWSALPAANREQKSNRPRRLYHVAHEGTRREKSCPECHKEHFLYECQTFKEADIYKKWEMAKRAKLCFKCLKYTHSRLNCKAYVCKKCGRWHHTVLHSDKPLVPEKRQEELEVTKHSNGSEERQRKEQITSVHTTVCEGQAYLKIVPVDLYGPKGTTQVLALLDEGSTVSLLDSRIAEQIGLNGKTEPLTIETVGGKGILKSTSQLVSLKLKGAHQHETKVIRVRTMEGLKLAKQEISKDILKGCKHLEGLADKLVYEKGEPQLLIGQDNWGLIITRKLKKGKRSQPVASLTSLGWVLHGHDGRLRNPIKFVNHTTIANEEDVTEEMVRRHFEIESLGVMPRRPSNDADRRALEVLEQTTKRLPSGRFESGLLWRKENEELPNNYKQAYKRLINIEKKLDGDENLRKSYKEQIQHLFDSGYAEPAPPTSSRRTFYLPHFAVMHPIKKKPRIVFDAAAKFNGKSLNDVLLPGPDLLQSLFGVLIRFRERPVAIAADIKEMFLQVKMREEDRDSLRFLWRTQKRTGEPEEFRMTSLIFGAASSPSTAIYVMNKNAEEFKEEYPAAVEAIRRNHYMDDYLHSFGSVEEAKKISNEVSMIQERGGFHLTKWSSNDKRVLEGIEESNNSKVIEFDKEEKTLGLRWLLDEDALAFNKGLRNTPREIIEGKRTPTKREVTSAIMSIFDPMGFAAPVLIQGKKLMQDIWRTKIGWDDKINEEQKTAWLRYLKEILLLTELKIPRCLSPTQSEGQLHTFSDASEEAYSAAVYWRTIEPDGSVHIALVAGKARVAPTKPTSIPRLELQAALLGSRLASAVEMEMNLKVTKKFYWTDSTTVLQWVKADPRKFKTFVAHRLAEIEDLTKPQDWRWVPTKENPADDATRGTPKEFSHTARWFQGPDFLYHDEEEWPKREFKYGETHTGEEKAVHTVAVAKLATKSEIPDPKRFSSWIRLLRTTARIFQFIDILKKRIETKESVNAIRKKRVNKRSKKENVNKADTDLPKRTFIPLEEQHLKRAEEILVKKSQKESFDNEISHLKNKKCLENSSRLRRVDVYLDDKDIIKLRSRTSKILVEGRESNPVVLDGKNTITRLLIEFYHRKFLHANTATVMNEMRQRYWILGLRTTIKAIIHSCKLCKVKKGLPQVPPTGNLPAERLSHHQHPFTCTGVDYFGPMQVTIGRRTEKRWGVLFTCLTTRAIHLELANSLSTSSMIMALRRMAARRGTPKVIFSDNGTNFVGANRELEEAACKEGIKWKFIPPGCPNMGGSWERLVKSVKTALQAVLRERNPPEEVVHTLLTEVEHVVNSRPLTDVSMDPEDEESLTPNHFLIGRSCGAISPGEFDDKELVRRANWKTAQRLADHFWSRWIKEYLPTLMPRKITGTITVDPQVGDVVLIIDSSLPRNTWPKGEVVKTYPGPDNRVRILDVRTNGGILRRPTRRVVILEPASTSHKERTVLCTAGENVSDVEQLM